MLVIVLNMPGGSKHFAENIAWDTLAQQLVGKSADDVSGHSPCAPISQSMARRMESCGMYWDMPTACHMQTSCKGITCLKQPMCKIA
jgi:hypothetical protein